MLRVSKLTDYATVLMAALAELPEELASASDLAERAQIELPTVSKLLKQLAGAGLIESRRGVNGGYRLARPARDISVLDIVTAIEGPIGMTECCTESGLCDHESHCGVRVNWLRISEAIRTALQGVTLADMLATPPRRAAGIPLRVAIS